MATIQPNISYRQICDSLGMPTQPLEEVTYHQVCVDDVRHIGVQIASGGEHLWGDSCSADDVNAVVCFGVDADSVSTVSLLNSCEVCPDCLKAAVNQTTSWWPADPVAAHGMNQIRLVGYITHCWKVSTRCDAALNDGVSLLRRLWDLQTSQRSTFIQNQPRWLNEPMNTGYAMQYWGAHKQVITRLSDALSCLASDAAGPAFEGLIDMAAARLATMQYTLSVRADGKSVEPADVSAMSLWLESKWSQWVSTEDIPEFRNGVAPACEERASYTAVPLEVFRRQLRELEDPHWYLVQPVSTNDVQYLMNRDPLAGLALRMADKVVTSESGAVGVLLPEVLGEGGISMGFVTSASASVGAQSSFESTSRPHKVTMGDPATQEKVTQIAADMFIDGDDEFSNLSIIEPLAYILATGS